MSETLSPQPFSHEPVMVSEVLEVLDAVPDGLLLDATVGGGGHAAAILEHRDGLRLVGVDRDPEALAAAASRLSPYGDRVRLVRSRFDAIDEALTGSKDGLVGALFDLGVSSYQLERAERGFSYRRSGPLDMRMDQTRGEPASALVNRASEDVLATLFAQHGEARFARRIARAIVGTRPLADTVALARVVESAIPAAARRRGHPARRVFQALRVTVNEELEQLRPALDAVIDRLVPGGRLVVVSYHSGEDRLVKALFDERASGGCVCPPGLPCVCGASSDFSVLRRGALLARPTEIARNPRAEAARLRVLARAAETGRT